MEGSLFRDTVEENLQKINLLGYGSVILVAGFWSPLCVRGGQFCRVTVAVATLVFKQPLRADAMNCRGRGHTENGT